jgi:hypothetical protein
MWNGTSFSGTSLAITPSSRLGREHHCDDIIPFHRRPIAHDASCLSATTHCVLLQLLSSGKRCDTCLLDRRPSLLRHQLQSHPTRVDTENYCEQVCHLRCRCLVSAVWIHFADEWGSGDRRDPPARSFASSFPPIDGGYHRCFIIPTDGILGEASRGEVRSFPS